MNFGQAISACFSKYATFSGRADLLVGTARPRSRHRLTLDCVSNAHEKTRRARALRVFCFVPEAFQPPDAA